MVNPNTKKLLELNSKFYEQIVAEFDTTRQYSSKGWERGLSHFISQFDGKNFGVLDLACGNGRFYEYLRTLFESKFTYTGVDNNSDLLKIATTRYRDSNNATFINTDVLATDFTLNTTYDLVTCFGFTHHIPTANLRNKFFVNVAKLVSSKGFVIITFWYFDKSRAKSKLTENNDFLLLWDNNQNITRYCHYYESTELENIIKIFELNKFTLVDKYRSDGKNNQANLYIVLQKQ